MAIENKNPFEDKDVHTLSGRRDFTMAGVAHRTRGVGTYSFTGQVADGETVTVDLTDGRSFVFEFDDDSSVVTGNIAVDITGNASASDDADDLQSVMATELVGVAQTARHTEGSVEQVLVIAGGLGSVEATLSDTAANVDSESVHGDVAHGSPQVVAATRSPTSQELTDGVMHFPMDFLVQGHFLAIRDSSNALKSFDGSSTADNLFSIVTVSNAGATVPFASGDTVSVLVWGTNEPFDSKQVFD